jgi:glyoxylase-like metal-dependent hydrolase (beta-lactamase superfamily II)
VTLEVVSMPLGVYGTNCYVVAQPESSEAVVVDPGDTPDTVARVLDDRGWTPRGILVTHGHIDHIGGINGVADAYQIEVWAPRGEAVKLREHESAAYEPQHLLEGDETVELAGISFRTFAVPGHSSASIAYATEGIVFSGDVLFAGSIGRTDLEGGDLDTLVASIGRLMDALPGETIVASGHGPATTLERERQTNPFLGALRS